MRRMNPLLAVIGLLVFAAMAAFDVAATASAQECTQPYAAFHDDAAAALPDLTVKEFKADEVKLLVADAAKETGRDLSSVTGARLLYSKENGTAAIILLNGECMVLAAQGPAIMVFQIMERALGNQT